MKNVILYDIGGVGGEGSYQVEFYRTRNGKQPFAFWFRRLDTQRRIAVLTRLKRFQDGNFGDQRHLGANLYEGRFRSGMRVYYGIWRDQLILLLVGGDKGSQSRDLFKAKGYWNEYRNDKTQKPQK